MKQQWILLILLLNFQVGFCQKELNKQLLMTLGAFPNSPTLKIDTLEILQIDNGKRLKIEFLSEQKDTLFQRPDDKIQAYLFVPDIIEKEERPDQSSDDISNKNQVESFKKSIQYAKDGNFTELENIIFDGSHEFPYLIRQHTYQWLDEKLDIQ